MFLASCHSEKVGEVFIKNGVKHVICVRRDVPIEDNTSIEFAKTFYSMFFSGNDVCRAFNLAK